MYLDEESVTWLAPVTAIRVGWINVGNQPNISNLDLIDLLRKSAKCAIIIIGK